MMNQAGDREPAAVSAVAGAGSTPETETDIGQTLIPRTFGTDQPPDSIEGDKLNRAPFAVQLAEALQRIESPKGTVVAIDGPWGSGKTSILNFLEEALKGDDDNVIVRFNPWWFAGRSELASALLHEVSSSFPGSKKLLKRGRKYVGGIAGAAQFIPYSGIAAPAKKAEEWAKGTPSLSTSKREFDDELAKSRKRLFIFVDDVDRLEPGEIGDLFSAIKALADFPNAIYVVALDSVQVAAQLTSATSMDGSSYLEKLIQVSFPVPLPNRDGLQTLLLDDINEIVGDSDMDPNMFNQEEWNDQFTRSLMPLIRTPRDVVRVANALRLTYESVRDEVNIVDFVLFQAIRVLEPSVYKSIVSNLFEFGLPADAMSTFFRIGNEDEERAKEFHSGILSSVSPRERKDALDRALAFLFPPYAKATDHMASGRSGSDRAHRRLADSETFQSVLSLTLTEDLVSLSERQQIVQVLPDRELFDRWLAEQHAVKLAENLSRLSTVLPEASRRVPDLDEAERVSAFNNVLGDVDFVFSGERSLYIGRPDAESALVWLAIDLLKSFDADTRQDRAEAALMQSDSVLVPSLFVRRLATDLGINTDSSATMIIERGDTLPTGGMLTGDGLARLEQIVSLQLLKASDEDTFLDLPRIVWLLSEWHRWDPQETFAIWAKGVLSDVSQFGRLLGIAYYREAGNFEDDPKLQVGLLTELFDTDQLREAAKLFARTSHDSEKLALAYEFLTATDPEEEAH